MESTGFSPVFLTVVLLLIAGLAVFLFVRHLASQRSEAYERLAKGRGWRYASSAEPQEWRQWGAFPLFDRGNRYGRRATNLISGELDGFDIISFDYRFVTGSGQHSTRHHQSVACLRSDRLQLPAFELRPEHFGHKIATALGYSDIDFDASPEFSSRYLLRGEHETRVRKLFNSTLRRELEKSELRSIEGQGGGLLIYRQRKRCKPDEAFSFIRDAVACARHFVA